MTFKALDFEQMNLGSSPTVIHVRHWSCQEGHPAKISPIQQSAISNADEQMQALFSASISVSRY